MKLFRTGLVGLLVAASVVFVPTASADPDAVAAAKDKLDRIHEESAQLDAQLIETITRAEESESKLEVLKQDLSAQESKVSQLGTNLGDLAMMQLNGGGLGGGVDITGQLLGSTDDTTFLSGLSTIQNETDRSVADLQTLQVEQARLDTLRSEQETIDASLKADRAAKEKLSKEYEAKEAEAQQVYDRLSAEEQERLKKLEEQRQQEEAAREQATRESSSPNPPERATSPILQPPPRVAVPDVPSRPSATLLRRSARATSWVPQGLLVLTAPGSCSPPTSRSASPCHAPPRPRSRRVHPFPRGICNPETWSSTTAASRMWACTSAMARSCTLPIRVVAW